MGPVGTMTERRRWKAEEKLTIIKESKGNDRVVETCRKYSLGPDMCYKWKESYETFGLDGLESHYIRMEPGVEKHMKENEKLKHKLQRRS
ncbi:MAG: helix-turn-helix domain-containing protein [Thermoplasmataceae archaeon]